MPIFDNMTGVQGAPLDPRRQMLVDFLRQKQAQDGQVDTLHRRLALAQALRQGDNGGGGVVGALGNALGGFSDAFLQKRLQDAQTLQQAQQTALQQGMQGHPDQAYNTMAQGQTQPFR